MPAKDEPLLTEGTPLKGGADVKDGLCIEAKLNTLALVALATTLATAVITATIVVAGEPGYVPGQPVSTTAHTARSAVLTVPVMLSSVSFPAGLAFCIGTASGRQSLSLAGHVAMSTVTAGALLAISALLFIHGMPYPMVEPISLAYTPATALAAHVCMAVMYCANLRDQNTLELRAAAGASPPASDELFRFSSETVSALIYTLYALVNVPFLRGMETTYTTSTPLFPLWLVYATCFWLGAVGNLPRGLQVTGMICCVFNWFITPVYEVTPAQTVPWGMVWHTIIILTFPLVAFVYVLGYTPSAAMRDANPMLSAAARVGVGIGAIAVTVSSLIMAAVILVLPVVMPETLGSGVFPRPTWENELIMIYIYVAAFGTWGASTAVRVYKLFAPEQLHLVAVCVRRGNTTAASAVSEEPSAPNTQVGV